MNFFLKYILLPLFLFSGSFFFAQITSEWTTFDESNSFLPNNTIQCLKVDRQNNLWIGTDWGLAKLEGDNWSIYNTSNSGLTDNSIRAIDVDAENTIWVGTTLGGLFNFDGTNWTQFNTSNSGIPTNFVRSIKVDSLNNKWVGTVEGLAKFDGNSWQTWTIANAGILSNNITSIAEGKNHMMFIGTINGGLLYIQNNNLNNYTILTNSVPDNSSITVQVDKLGKPWYASTAQGLFTDVGNQVWMVFNVSNSGIPSNSLTTMKLDLDQNFYIGTHLNGLSIRTKMNEWRNYTTDNSSLPENHILSLEKDSSGYIWIGTYSKGLVRLHESALGITSQSAPETEIFPNPAESNSKINFSNALPPCTISIINQQGQLICLKENPSIIDYFHLPNLVSGVYFIEFKNELWNTRIRLVVY
jgi:ligand-binding sensor domain-containing protein